ncbi:MAG TPA: hypothetical protein VMT76_05545 [Puia sp.]|nr:hypothetical protein [Puia sp.]
MRQKRIIFLLGAIVSFLLLANCKKSSTQQAGRSFYMGVTPWPADFTDAELDTAYAFINNHCDIVSHHFDDGIPYEEAYSGNDMPNGLIQDVQVRKSKTAAGKKILLSVAPLDHSRIQKATYYSKDTVTDSMRNYWNNLPVDDPRMVAAYTRFVSYLIDQLQPSFVNYGVESNSLMWDPTQFSLYRNFLRQVYAQLKAKYPSIPFFLSFMVDESAAGLSNANSLLPYSDFIGLSAYPYVTVSSSVNGNTDPSLFPSGYFERFIHLDNSKPFLFAETGYIAEDLFIPSLNLNKQGTEAWQQAYLEMVLQLCQSHQAKMLIWYCSKDYDAGDSTLKALNLYSDVFGIWQDIGLKDAAGAERPSLQTWLKWQAQTLTH